MRKFLALALVLISVFGMAATAESRDRVASIRAKGFLSCGIWPIVRGFSFQEKGTYQGFEIDICKAVAAAILGARANVRYIAIDNIAQFSGNNEIDMVSRRLTWTFGRGVGQDIIFGPITFYDGQGFLVPVVHGVTSPLELSGKNICVLDSESHLDSLNHYFRQHAVNVNAVLVKTNSDARAALEEGRCVAYSADISWLAAARAEFIDGVNRYAILSTLITKEPIAPLLHRDDGRFFEVVRWTVFAMLEAEERDISSGNLDAALRTDCAEVRRFLGLIPGNAATLGLEDGWVRDVIASVGNYGEVFDRNLGNGSPVKLDRGLNRLWTDGGLFYVPPLR